MKRFQIETTNVNKDLDILTEYLENQLTLYLNDDERIGYEAMLTGVKNAIKKPGMYIIRFDMDEKTAHKIMQYTIADVSELYPYANEPDEAGDYYRCKVDTLLHVIGMMCNPFYMERM
jgi:hypothetical protein